MKQYVEKDENELSALCDSVRQLTFNGEYPDCEKLIADAMGRHPHAPQPHNLMGILYEMRDDRASAMKHFRAAWSLDPTYLPARHNLNCFASFSRVGNYAFSEDDCPANEEKYTSKIEYDDHGVGRLRGEKVEG